MSYRPVLHSIDRCHHHHPRQHPGRFCLAAWACDGLWLVKLCGTFRPRDILGTLAIYGDWQKDCRGPFPLTDDIPRNKHRVAAQTGTLPWSFVVKGGFGLRADDITLHFDMHSIGDGTCHNHKTLLAHARVALAGERSLWSHTTA